MILTIILMALLVIGIVFAIIGKVADVDVLDFIGGPIAGLDGFLLAIIAACQLSVHSNYYKNQVRLECEEQIASIQNTRLALENKIESNTLTILEVNTYNDSVKEFKTKIKKEQLALQNPWANWFVCPVYSEFNPDVVSYLYV